MGCVPVKSESFAERTAVGYLAWEFPTNRLLQRLPLAKYTAFNIIMWGLVLALFAIVGDFSGAVAIRFFLGLFEAAVTPGFAFFTSQVIYSYSLLLSAGALTLSSGIRSVSKVCELQYGLASMVLHKSSGDWWPMASPGAV